MIKRINIAIKRNNKKSEMSLPGLRTKTCSRSFRLLIRVVIYQIVHLDK